MSQSFDCRIEHETDAAIKVVIVETGEIVWFPLSAVNEIHRANPKTNLPSQIVVEDWIAKAKGLT